MTTDAQLVVTLAASLLAFFACSTWTSKNVTMSHVMSNPLIDGVSGTPQLPNDSTGQSDGGADEGAESSVEISPYEPSVADVLVTKAMLNKALHLPPEVVDAIVDHAEYWPHTTTERVYNGATVVARGRGEENTFLLRSIPLGLRDWDRVSGGTEDSPVDRTPLPPHPPGEEFPTDDLQQLIAAPVSMLAHPCRRIVFTIRSRDQGWGGGIGNRGTYNGSWTWFEAGLERWCETSSSQRPPPEQAGDRENEQRSLNLNDLCTVYPEVVWDQTAVSYTFTHPLQPIEELTIQRNLTAGRDSTVHRVVWSYTDDINPQRDTEAAVKLSEKGRGSATGNGKFVRDLKLGDVVTLWAKARFPAWANFVESARMDVYYAI